MENYELLGLGNQYLVRSQYIKLYDKYITRIGAKLKYDKTMLVRVWIDDPAKHIQLKLVMDKTHFCCDHNAFKVFLKKDPEPWPEIDEQVNPDNINFWKPKNPLYLVKISPKDLLIPWPYQSDHVYVIWDENNKTGPHGMLFEGFTDVAGSHFTNTGVKSSWDSTHLEDNSGQGFLNDQQVLDYFGIPRAQLVQLMNDPSRIENRYPSDDQYREIFDAYASKLETCFPGQISRRKEYTYDVSMAEYPNETMRVNFGDFLSRSSKQLMFDHVVCRDTSNNMLVGNFSIEASHHGSRATPSYVSAADVVNRVIGNLQRQYATKLLAASWHVQMIH